MHAHIYTWRSLPSLVTPISNKRSLGMIFSVVFMLVAAFYSLLCLTAVFRFPGEKKAN